MISYIVIAILFSLSSIVHSAKILAVFPIPSKSHVILGSELLKGFAEHGHEVTMLSSFPLEDPPKNYRDIVIGQEQMRKVYETNILSSYGFNNKVVHIYSALTKLCEAVYEDRNVQAFINSDEQFDAIIYLESSMDSLWGMSHKFNASTILFSVIGAIQLTSYKQGNPLPSSYIPHFLLDLSEVMTFWERTYNLFSNTMGYLYLHFWNDPTQRKLLRKHFPAAPSLDALYENIELFFLNSHVAVDAFRPTFPNMINIGGYYLKNSKSSSLPEDIRTFLDKSELGVILFSFGSNLHSGNLDPILINHFLEYFRQSPYNILWKFDIDLPNKSPNVKILNWVPQRDVLGHQNVKLFISHGGKGSVNEAIYYGVPMIIIPFYLDQHMNAGYCARMEIAIKIDFKDVTSETLKNAEKAIESDRKYRKNMQQHSSLFKNQEVDPMVKAIYWTEYVINNRGSKFLKSPASSMRWYQLELLDVISFAMLIIIILLIVFCYICKWLSGYLRSTVMSNQSNKEKYS